MSEAPFPVTPARRRWWSISPNQTPATRLGQFVLACLVLGLVLAPVWARTSRLPGYVIGDDFTAHIDELGLSQVFASDASFVVLTGVLGLAVGALAWIGFHRLGAWVCLIAVMGAVIGSMTAWLFGLILGQRGFSERLAAAAVGDVVPVDLQLHAHAAVLVGPFMAILVVMLGAAFWPEPADVPAAALVELPQDDIL